MTAADLLARKTPRHRDSRCEGYRPDNPAAYELRSRQELADSGGADST